MKKKYVAVNAIVFILVVMLASLTQAEGMTARSFAMGEAFTGVSDDLGAILFNPAGLNQSGFVGLQANAGLEVTDTGSIQDLLEFSGQIADDNVTDVLALVPEDASLKTSVFSGANFKSFGLAVNNTIEASSFRSDTSGTVSLDNITEGTICYGRQLTNLPLNMGALSYGVNARVIKVDRVTYNVMEASIREDKLSGTGLGVDLGLLAKVTDLLKVGVQLKNAIAPDIVLTGTQKEYSYVSGSWEESTITEGFSGDWVNDRTFRVGASLYVPVINLTLAADIDKIKVLSSTDDGQVIHLGVEKNLFFNALSLRAGSIIEGEENYNTFGLGLNLTGFHLDAALGTKDFKSGMTGLLSFNVKF